MPKIYWVASSYGFPHQPTSIGERGKDEEQGDLGRSSKERCDEIRFLLRRAKRDEKEIPQVLHAVARPRGRRAPRANVVARENRSDEQLREWSVRVSRSRQPGSGRKVMIRTKRGSDAKREARRVQLFEAEPFDRSAA